MMDEADLRQIAEWLEAAGLYSIEISSPGCSVRIVVGAEVDTRPLAAPGEMPDQGSAPPAILAAAAGVFLAAHPSRSAPFVAPSDAVKRGDIVGLLRIGRICVPVTAPEDGIAGDLLAEPGATVGFGTPLLQFYPGAESAGDSQGKD